MLKIEKTLKELRDLLPHVQREAEERLHALDAEGERLLVEIDGVDGLDGVGVELRRLADCRGIRLDGTEEQVAWATKIRAEYIDNAIIVDARKALEYPVEAAAHVEELKDLEDAQISHLRMRLARNASFWIDNRDVLGYGFRHIAVKEDESC